MPEGTLLLNRGDIASLLGPSDYIEIVENAFRQHALGRTLSLGLLHIDSEEGEFHIKAGGVKDPRIYFGLKTNGGFFRNWERYGLPNIQGTILLCDGDNGTPLAVMDSTHITIHRTGATTAVAAKYLARPDSRTLTVCGCGTQGRIQTRYLREVVPLERAFAYDQDGSIARRFASEMAEELDMEVTPVSELAEALARSDVCVTCTPARRQFVRFGHLRPGTFLAAVGADSPDKQELDPRILASSKVVVDFLDQCATVGELHHAIEAGLLSAGEVHAQLQEVVAGEKSGRASDSEIIVFDATGSGLQDAAGAAAVYEKATKEGVGFRFDFFAS
jgi:ornithine cyclodeaminase/alanine dehydrogenase